MNGHTSFGSMHRTYVVEFGGRAKRGVDLVGVVEQGVIDLVLPGLLPERNYVLEPVTPKYLRGQVRAACLSCHSGRLDHTWKAQKFSLNFFYGGYIMCIGTISTNESLFFLYTLLLGRVRYLPQTLKEGRFRFSEVTIYLIDTLHNKKKFCYVENTIPRNVQKVT